MEIHRDDQVIGDGELYHSGEYYCICPSDQTLELMDPEGLAQLFLEKHGQMAKLEIKNGHCFNRAIYPIFEDGSSAGV